jgi:hypothetical protein
VVKKVWPQRNADRSFAIKKTFFAHPAAQFLKNKTRKALVCCEQVVEVADRLFAQRVRRCCAFLSQVLSV